jgi:hypothetical protein
MSHQRMKPGANPLNLHKKWAEPEFWSLHFRPVTLTIGLPDSAYWTADEKERRIMGSRLRPNCHDGAKIFAHFRRTARASQACLPGPEKMRNNSDGD